MTIKNIGQGLYQISLPGVHAFLLDGGSDGLILIDAGVPGSGAAISKAVKSLGRDITEVRHILVTHCHPDHAGGLAELRSLTRARIHMHRRDALLVSAGKAMRRMVPSPGILNAVLYRAMIAPKPTTIAPCKIDQLVGNGDVIPVAGGISAIHTPGHTEGHLVFLAKKQGIAFLGDAAANFLGLREMVAYEHVQQGVMSLRNLCRLDFQTACFGHGAPILGGADRRFREKWGKGKAVRIEGRKKSAV